MNVSNDREMQISFEFLPRNPSETPEEVWRVTWVKEYRGKEVVGSSWYDSEDAALRCMERRSRFAPSVCKFTRSG